VVSALPDSLKTQTAHHEVSCHNISIYQQQE